MMEMTIQDKLLKKGWFRNTGVSAGHGVVTSPASNTLGKWLEDFGKYKHQISKPSNINNAYIGTILEMIDLPRKKIPYQATTVYKGDKSQLMASLLLNGWYKAMADSSLSSLDKPVDETQDQDESLPMKPTDDVMKEKKSHSLSAKHTGKDIGPENDLIRGKPVDYNDNILDKKIKRTKSATKSGDKTSKKTKKHNSAVNNLLQTGWTVMNRNSHQITLVKIPDNNSTNSKHSIKCGKPKNKETTDLNGIVDVDVNVDDIATRKKSVLRKFIRGSRKILRRLRCGRTEE